MVPGVSLAEGATLRAARHAGLHPSVDPIGQRTRAALGCWEQMIGGDAPEVIAAWAGEDSASVLLGGPLDPAVGVPRQTGTALGLEVTFSQYRRFKPDKHKQLVLATVAGEVPPRIMPDRAWRADGLLVPFGSTRAGVLYLPLLGPSEAGPLSLSGPAATDLLASLLVFALARVGAGRVHALVYQEVLPLVEGLVDAESFGAGDLGSLRLRLEDEWKRRALQIGDARADDVPGHALQPDAEPIPLLLLIIGPQAATEMGLLDPSWPYVLREAGRKGMGILVWGEVATAPRRVHVSRADAAFHLDVPAELVDYDLPALRFTPTLLSQEVREEAAAILHAPLFIGPTPQGTAAGEADDPSASAIVDAHETSPQTDLSVSTAAAEPALRRLYLLGGARAEYAGAPIDGWRRRHALELLAFLAAHPQGRSADAVVEALWPEAHATRARTHLRQLVREARVRLAGDPDHAPMILFRDGIYRLDWQHIWADVETFRRAIVQAAQASDQESFLREAAALYRGEFCKDTYYSWTEPIREELERSYLDAVVRLADLLLERGALEDAQRIVGDALALNPYIDALVQRAIVLDARRFGLRAARDRLHGFQARLREDLAVDPDPATIAALERVTRELSTDS